MRIKICPMLMMLKDYLYIPKIKGVLVQVKKPTAMTKRRIEIFLQYLIIVVQIHLFIDFIKGHRTFIQFTILRALMLDLNLKDMDFWFIRVQQQARTPYTGATIHQIRPVWYQCSRTARG